MRGIHITCIFGYFVFVSSISFHLPADSVEKCVSEYFIEESEVIVGSVSITPNSQFHSFIMTVSNFLKVIFIYVSDF